jgi:hypothetical protein
MRIGGWLTVLLVVLAASACRRPPSVVNTAAIPAAALEKLPGKRIFFAHQSVGYDILAGIHDLMAEDPRLKLNIVDTKVGKNGFPRIKLEDFTRMVESGAGRDADIAIFKLCYRDFDASTDSATLFAAYQATMAALKTKAPRTTFVLVTSPLVVRQAGWKAGIKTLLGRPLAGEEDNIARERFNQSMRQEYQGKQPLFDLAAAESTYPDGHREEFEHNGIRYEALIRDYTDDGAHLNARGRRIAALRLIECLAGLVK